MRTSAVGAGAIFRKALKKIRNPTIYFQKFHDPTNFFKTFHDPTIFSFFFGLGAIVDIPRGHIFQNRVPNIRIRN